MNQADFSKKYTVNTPQDLIGNGIHGEVFLAQDNESDTIVAIKNITIRAEEVDSNWPLNNIEHLIKLPAFRNIVKYKEIDILEEPTAHTRFIVMPYASEGHLNAYTSNNRLSVSQKKEIALQLLEGLRFLHRYQIIHYHLKPTNVLVFISNTGKVTIKISDYGMVDSDALYDDASINYMSPEQWLGLPKDTNTDLWSFGLLIYELFTGERCLSVDSYFQRRKLIDSTALHESVQKQIQETDFNLLPGLWATVVSHCLTWDSSVRAHDEFDIDMLLSGATPALVKTIVPPPPAAGSSPPPSDSNISSVPSSDSEEEVHSEEINESDTQERSSDYAPVPKKTKLFFRIAVSVIGICLLVLCAFFAYKYYVISLHRSSTPYVVANIQGPAIPEKILPRDLLHEYWEESFGFHPNLYFLKSEIIEERIKENFGADTYNLMYRIGYFQPRLDKKMLGDTVQYRAIGIDQDKRQGYILFYKTYLAKNWMELYFMKEGLYADRYCHYLPEGAWVRSYLTNEYGEENPYCPILKQSFQEADDEEDYFNIWIMKDQIIVYRSTSGFWGGKRKFETFTLKNRDTGKERTLHLGKPINSSYIIKNQSDISFITESLESSNTTFVIHDHTFFLGEPVVYEYNLYNRYTKCKAQMYDYLYHKTMFTEDEN